jgi:outer membrane protein
MNRILTVVLGLAAVSFVPRLAAAADQKICYVDLQRALEETEEGKKIKSRLKSEYERKQKELDTRQEELKKLKADLDKQAAVLKPEALQVKSNELAQKLSQLQETYMRLQRDLQEKEAAETGKIFKKLQGVIAQLAQGDGCTYVLEKNAGILYAPPSLELTNELIRKFNALPAGK